MFQSAPATKPAICDLNLCVPTVSASPATRLLPTRPDAQAWMSDLGLDRCDAKRFPWTSLRWLNIESRRGLNSALLAWGMSLPISPDAWSALDARPAGERFPRFANGNGNISFAAIAASIPLTGLV